MKILVVDDSKTMRRILTMELEEAEYEVITAADGNEALEAWEEENPDIVTMDVDMPGMNGFDCVTELRRREEERYGEARTVVIFITANDTVADRERGFLVGASDFLAKPMPRGELAKRITSACKQPDKDEATVTALVAEDSSVARHVLVSALHQEGFTVLEAADGEIAYELAKQHHEELDLIVTDYVMPGMTGADFCRKVREELKLAEIPIIFLSAVSEKSFILEMFASGGNDYLLKPFAKEELVARIRVHLEMQKLNRQLHEKVAELEQLNKQKDEFLAVTSHDLRSPLTSISGFAEILLMDESLTEEQREFLKYIEDSATFLGELIRDVLEVARMQAQDARVEYSIVNLADVLESSVRTARHSATPKAIHLNLETGEEELPVMGNYNQLLRIANNLISNAVKFTPEKGTITVTAAADNDRVVMTVRDTGIGIPEDKLPVLFDKFSEASRAGTAGEQSTGLGMSITRDLVEQHQGSINVDSTVGEGTVFTVTMPWSGQEAAISV